jgi:hypothetical protein
LNLLQAIKAAKEFPIQYADIPIFSTNTLEALLLEI